MAGRPRGRPRKSTKTATVEHSGMPGSMHSQLGLPVSNRMTSANDWVSILEGRIVAPINAIAQAKGDSYGEIEPYNGPTDEYITRGWYWEVMEKGEKLGGLNFLVTIAASKEGTYVHPLLIFDYGANFPPLRTREEREINTLELAVPNLAGETQRDDISYLIQVMLQKPNTGIMEVATSALAPTVSKLLYLAFRTSLYEASKAAEERLRTKTTARVLAADAMQQ